VIFAGSQKIRIVGLGKEEQETAFAFRFGDCAFKAIDPLGQAFQGHLEGARCRWLEAAPAHRPESGAALVNLIRESARDAGCRVGFHSA
jgi:hypothetical protein